MDSNQLGAEIELAEALLKQARALRGKNNPNKAIAAAGWEIRIQRDLDSLKRLRDDPEASAAAGRTGGGR